MDKEWVTVPSVGKLFWGVKASNFQLNSGGWFGKSSVGCNPSCGGVIDSGTSLLTPPAEVVEAIQTNIENGNIEDCSDISKFPDFVFKLGDETFSLPASTYIADAGSQQIQQVFH